MVVVVVHVMVFRNNTGLYTLLSLGVCGWKEEDVPFID